MDLDGRKQTVLRAIVEHYVRSGEPVGSKSVADDPTIDVSSATIRNEMGALEREGYIAQPHTSAGRVPTDKGYRYYVDMLAPKQTTSTHKAQIERELAGTLSALDELLERASALLADLTDFTAIASAPPIQDATLRWIELIPLGGRRVLVICVGDGARHEDILLELTFEPSPDVVRSSSQRANRVIAGTRATEASDVLLKAADGDDLLIAVAEALRIVAAKKGRIFTGGTSHLVSWEAPSAAQRLLEAIETGAPMFVRTAPDTVDIRIGRELAMDDLTDLSLIAAGYALGRQAGGTLGVIGPTRMDYPTVISTVSMVAQTLSQALRRLEES